MIDKAVYFLKSPSGNFIARILYSLLDKLEIHYLVNLNSLMCMIDFDVILKYQFIPFDLSQNFFFKLATWFCCYFLPNQSMSSFDT